MGRFLFFILQIVSPMVAALQSSRVPVLHLKDWRRHHKVMSPMGLLLRWGTMGCRVIINKFSSAPRMRKKSGNLFCRGRKPSRNWRADFGTALPNIEYARSLLLSRKKGEAEMECYCRGVLQSHSVSQGTVLFIYCIVYLLYSLFIVQSSTPR